MKKVYCQPCCIIYWNRISRDCNYMIGKHKKIIWYIDQYANYCIIYIFLVYYLCIHVLVMKPPCHVHSLSWTPSTAWPLNCFLSVPKSKNQINSMHEMLSLCGIDQGDCNPSFRSSIGYCMATYTATNIRKNLNLWSSYVMCMDWCGCLHPRLFDFTDQSHLERNLSQRKYVHC